MCYEMVLRFLTNVFNSLADHLYFLVNDDAESLLITSELGRIFTFILLIICLFYTARGTHVGGLK